MQHQQEFSPIKVTKKNDNGGAGHQPHGEQNNAHPGSFSGEVTFMPNHQGQENPENHMGIFAKQGEAANSANTFLQNATNAANAAAVATTAPITPSGTNSPSKKDASLDCPHPKDILFPIFSYQLWAGNVRFIRLIKSKRVDFENAKTRAIQASMAIKILEAVEKDGGRFLTAVETPDNDHAMIVCTTRWRLLSKKEILTEIIRFLKRQDTESLREAKKAKRDDRRKEKLERRRIRHKELIDRQKLPKYEDTEEYKQEPKGPISGPLMTLYYVPPFNAGNKQDIDEEDRESMGVSDDNTEEEEEPAPKKRKAASRKKAKVIPKKSPVIKKAPATSPKESKLGYFGKPKSTKSLKAAESEGIADLPKGVTVRPSGKWQAQTYFAGQSRYVGVYENSILAAKAYEVVQEYLNEYRNSNKLPKDTPKEELAAIFSQARIAAEQAVYALQESGGFKRSLFK